MWKRSKGEGLSWERCGFVEEERSVKNLLGHSKMWGICSNLGWNPFPIWAIEPFPRAKPQAQLLKRTMDKLRPKSRELEIHAFAMFLMFQICCAQISTQNSQRSDYINVILTFLDLISAQLQVYFYADSRGEAYHIYIICVL